MTQTEYEVTVRFRFSQDPYGGGIDETDFVNEAFRSANNALDAVVIDCEPVQYADVDDPALD